MRIGVISDTHIPVRAAHVPKRVLREFEGVDLILHAGDLIALAVLDELRAVAPVQAVWGNMDPPEVRTQLPVRQIVEANGIRVGLIHGEGSPRGLAERVAREFKDDPVQVVVFGHSHTPTIEYRGEVLLFNPGTPTDRVFASSNSVGVLEVADRIVPEIVPL
jgi:hypothetical protein